MNASSLQMKLAYKNKIFSKVKRFNRKHKALTFLGIAYAFAAIALYDILFYFYRSSKRYICLACGLLFFVFSSSFSYPAMSLNISFASDVSMDGYSSDTEEVLSSEEVAESDAELAVSQDVDSELIKEAMESENPDVAEAEHLDPEKQASLSQILEATDDGTAVPENTDDGVNLSYLGVTNFDSSDWKILLVNKQHPIPDDYDFPLGTISGTMRCDERIIAPLLEMMRAANKDGVALIICSPYRDRTNPLPPPSTPSRRAIPTKSPKTLSYPKIAISGLDSRRPSITWIAP